MRTAILAAFIALAGCVQLPWTAVDSLERVERSGVLRAGIITESGGSPSEGQRRFVSAIAGETGSRPDIVSGPADDLLARVERGDLDIAVGFFCAETPWGKRVLIMPRARQMGIRDGGPAPAAAVGRDDLSWVMPVYRHAALLLQDEPGAREVPGGDRDPRRSRDACQG